MKYGGDALGDRRDDVTGLDMPLEVATRAHVIILERRELDELVFSQSHEIFQYGMKNEVLECHKRVVFFCVCGVSFY